MEKKENINELDKLFQVKEGLPLFYMMYKKIESKDIFKMVVEENATPYRGSLVCSPYYKPI